VDELEALKAVAGLSLLADGVEDGIDELSALSVVALGPVVASARLAEDEVVRTEELTERAGTDGIRGTGFEVDEDGTGHIAAAGGLVVVDVDTLDLELGVAAEFTARVNTMFIGDDLPEFGANLVAALSSLDVNDFSH